MTLRIGIDLDNTIIHYDDAFLKSAIERGLAQAESRGLVVRTLDRVEPTPTGRLFLSDLQALFLP